MFTLRHEGPALSSPFSVFEFLISGFCKPSAPSRRKPSRKKATTPKSPTSASAAERDIAGSLESRLPRDRRKLCGEIPVPCGHRNGSCPEEKDRQSLTQF